MNEFASHSAGRNGYYTLMRSWIPISNLSRWSREFLNSIFAKIINQNCYYLCKPTHLIPFLAMTKYLSDRLPFISVSSLLVIYSSLKQEVRPFTSLLGLLFQMLLQHAIQNSTHCSKRYRKDYWTKESFTKFPFILRISDERSLKFILIWDWVSFSLSLSTRPSRIFYNLWFPASKLSR